MPRKKIALVIAAFMVMMVGLNQISALHEFIDTVKKRAGNSGETAYANLGTWMRVHTSPLTKKETDMLRQIEEEAKKARVEPIDARVDPVWKAIPGYNGKEIDIEQTFELSRKAKTIHYVYKEIPPRISLKDLGAHPVYKGNPQKKMAALMINVAWGNEFIEPMLTTLRRENVKATFFFDGSWLSKNVELAKTIAADGHELSNHAYSHPNMSSLNRAQALLEITKTEKLLKEELGVENKLFAPPSGDFNQETVKIAHELGLQTVLWTLDTVDWRKPSPDWIVRRIIAKLEPGALILMHPTDSSNKALPELIQNIKRRGLALDTVSRLLSPHRTDMDTGQQIEE